MTIRYATAADLPALAPLAQQFYASSRFLRGFQQERFEAFWAPLLSGSGVILLGERDGAPVGALGGMVYQEPYSGELVAVEFFWFVDPGSRGGGMALYREFEEFARRCGCTQIRMAHLLDLMPEKLGRVYQRLGFTAMETHFCKEVA